MTTSDSLYYLTATAPAEEPQEEGHLWIQNQQTFAWRGVKIGEEPAERLAKEASSLTSEQVDEQIALILGL